MKTQILSILLPLTIVAMGCASSDEQVWEGEGQDVDALADAGQEYPNLMVNDIFENEHVIAQRLSGEAGEWAGEHSHAGNQLAVIVVGGTQTYRQDGEDTDVTYETGDSFWIDAVEAHDHKSDDADLSAVLLTFKDLGDAGMAAAQAYPNVEADVILENEYVLVQRLAMTPGEWVGEHGHEGNQAVVVVKGGTITYREGGVETPVDYADGDSFWIDAVEAHDHATTSEEPGSAILITIKSMRAS